MKCLECGDESERLTNEHLLQCRGLTLHEYAIRHQLPLDLLLHHDQVNQSDTIDQYPPPARHSGEAARATLEGLRWAGLLRTHGQFIDVPGEIRRLDLLLWDQVRLSDYGFRFRRDFEYTADTHRVVARNRLRVIARNLLPGPRSVIAEPPPAFLDSLAVYIGHSAEWLAGYLFMQFPIARYGNDVCLALSGEHGIDCAVLDAADQPEGLLLRTRTRADGERLLDLLADRLKAMPTVWQRFFDSTPQATVSKELVFDAAHFITDHPAKYSNLHGGRYRLQVEVSGRIDPVTGCVVDYGYLKRVVNRRVIERFDHHNLNYASPELAWRSSTEMLCAHIWESLIDYLPGLSGLRLYETTQSWCDYRGPTLAQYQADGPTPLLRPFAQIDQVERRRLLADSNPGLRAVGGDEVR